MVVMLVIALQHGLLSGSRGFTLTNFTDVLGDQLYRDVAWTTFQIATSAMLIQLAIAVPLAYVLAFKAGRWELPLLLFLVLADELNPMVRIYAWRMLLGREGLINEGLQRIGLIDAPIDALLFSKFAVDPRALDQLSDLHGDPDLRRDEGDRHATCSRPRATSARAGGRRPAACCCR